jgi:hypothetical protein
MSKGSTIDIYCPTTGEVCPLKEGIANINDTLSRGEELDSAAVDQIASNLAFKDSIRAIVLTGHATIKQSVAEGTPAKDVFLDDERCEGGPKRTLIFFGRPACQALVVQKKRG